jgi:hypothetical protein
MAANLIVLLLAAMAALGLAHPRLRRSDTWRATVTPLASIIGSGFLVLAPLLVREFGHRAVWVMAGLCGVAYLIGSAIRWNIAQGAGQAAGQTDTAASLEAWLERASNVTLSFAYVVSVCYYLNLLGAFALSLLPAAPGWAARTLTSAVIAGIALLGWRRGLGGLERAESLSVSIKLAVIAGLIGGMAWYAVGLARQHALQASAGHFDLQSLRLAFGLIITVQGFETSRYLREAYDRPTRIRTMRYAQWLSTAIYLAYIGLAGVIFQAAHVPLQETAVIGMTAPIASALPLLLVLAALAAQFSAAVADTNGCGGLVQEMSRGRIPSRSAYVGLAVLALALTWAANIYEIISYASRAFALYYALQCLQAMRFGLAARSWPRAIGYGLLALLMLAATVFGIPAE